MSAPGNRQRLRELEQLGCTLTITRKCHVKVRTPGGGVVVVSATPSDWRTVKNESALLRRAGVEVRW